MIIDYTLWIPPGIADPPVILTELDGDVSTTARLVPVTGGSRSFYLSRQSTDRLVRFWTILPGKQAVQSLGLTS